MTEAGKTIVALAKAGVPIRITLDNDCWWAVRTDMPAEDPEDDGDYMVVASGDEPPVCDLLPDLAEALGMTAEGC